MTKLLLAAFIFLASLARAEDAGLAELRKHADSSAEAACDYAEALAEAGDKPAARAWFRRALKKDPNCEAAHVGLADKRQEGNWVPQPLTPEERRVDRLIDLKQTALSRFDKPVVFLDGAPDAPFLLCMEKSDTYSAELMLPAFRDTMVSLYGLFQKRFSTIFDSKAFLADHVGLVYCFETRQRYLDALKAPIFSDGQYDEATGSVYLYVQTPKLVETLFMHGVRQLLGELGDGAKPVPFWLFEGAAQYFANFRHGPSGEFTLGGRSSEFLPLARNLAADGKLRGTEEFLRLSSADAAKFADRKDVRALQAQAWSFWYFLETASEGKLKAKLDALVKRELAGKGGVDAAKEILGDLKELDSLYAQFLMDAR